MQGSCSAMASAVNVAAVDRLAALIEPLWGQYAFLHSLIESRLHCFFDVAPRTSAFTGSEVARWRPPGNFGALPQLFRLLIGMFSAGNLLWQFVDRAQRGYVH